MTNQERALQVVKEEPQRYLTAQQHPQVVKLGKRTAKIPLWLALAINFLLVFFYDTKSMRKIILTPSARLWKGLAVLCQWCPLSPR